MLWYVFTKHSMRSKGICKAKVWKMNLASHRLLLNTKDKPGKMILGHPWACGAVGLWGFSIRSAPPPCWASLLPQMLCPPVPWAPALATLPTIVFPLTAGA